MDYPVLYSLHNCPYAMRARMVILLSGQKVMLRDIVLRNKPPQMLAASAKGTVPTLVVSQNEVIDQSLDIMLWALDQSDPHGLLYPHQPAALAPMLELIASADGDFRDKFKRYKCAARYHDPGEIQYRQQCLEFIDQLEQRLTAHAHLCGETPSLADYAILPFIRQLAKVDRQWYLQAPYPRLKAWLNGHLQSALFSKTMTKYPQYVQCNESFLLSLK